MGKLVRAQMSEETHAIITLYAKFKKISFPEAAKQIINSAVDGLGEKMQQELAAKIKEIDERSSASRKKAES